MPLGILGSVLPRDKMSMAIPISSGVNFSMVLVPTFAKASFAWKFKVAA